MTEQKKSRKGIGGRPTKMTDKTLAKLEEAFLMGCPDTEACLWADINPSTLYHYQEKHPEFIQRKEALRHKPALTARKNITQAIEEGDLDRSAWYLERKAKDEFGKGAEVTLKPSGEIGEGIETLADQIRVFLGRE